MGVSRVRMLPAVFVLPMMTEPSVLVVRARQMRMVALSTSMSFQESPAASPGRSLAIVRRDGQRRSGAAGPMSASAAVWCPKREGSPRRACRVLQGGTRSSA